ncbi:hypothetical protein F9C07_10418 [Aspergillus flavus]|uniref:Uncharacterized protein n=1 Tax=Aspergillus flavus (strain ATCC 200026 / FGSC A1120 / IAM 13836 / NRRL 3357 / JCM 12722 / SRRC 167) TaxID=332952 RepID=A0A7U2MVT6_ASPFN|nr:hypothetical protein F9C07_10418 [Aspergillus flavus]
MSRPPGWFPGGYGSRPPPSSETRSWPYSLVISAVIFSLSYLPGRLCCRHRVGS